MTAPQVSEGVIPATTSLVHHSVLPSNLRTFTLATEIAHYKSVPGEELIGAIENLVEDRESWHDVLQRLPQFTGQTGND